MNVVWMYELLKVLRHLTQDSFNTKSDWQFSLTYAAPLGLHI